MAGMAGVLDGGRYFEGPHWHFGRLSIVWTGRCIPILQIDA
jgi:hypothetical protein